MMYVIETHDLALKLEVVPVKSLLPHERVLPNISDKLIIQFKSWGNLHNPIIVDHHHLVLDGNHRAYVFKALDFRHIAACKIDYFNKGVKLRYWFRVLGNIEKAQPMTAMIESMGGCVHRVADKATLRQILAEKNLCFGMQQNDCYALFDFPETLVGDAVGAYDVLQRIQDRLTEQQSASLRYIPCKSDQNNDYHDEVERDEIIVWTPHITKDMVMSAAGRGDLFSPKSTRHLIPARPLNVDVPLQWFKENISLEAINNRFAEHLQGKRMREFGPGQIIDGRYYGEKVFVFHD